MAGYAFKGLVSAVQFKFSVFIMVKIPYFPVPSIVTTGTFRAQGSFVNIVLLVACIALRKHILKLSA